ncbi:hypothetical protein [Xenorhabdus sp. BG5]|nr:hypothetical protein [Xenorhabdus sp. BG5]MBE8596393.1 hypothetical protein [Xenorhabdus sp. BG5]
MAAKFDHFSSSRLFCFKMIENHAINDINNKNQPYMKKVNKKNLGALKGA